MNTFLGSFVVGDTTNRPRLTVTDDTGVPWGTAVGTGWTPTLEVRKAGDDALVTTLTGTWTDGTESACTFNVGGAAALAPAAGVASVEYDAILILTKLAQIAKFGAGDGRAGLLPFQFKVFAWP